MKKGLGILGVLLLLLAAGLVYFTPSPPPASLLRVLGTTTNNSQRYVTLNITNSTGGRIACVPIQILVVTNGGVSTTNQPVQTRNWIGFTEILKPSMDCTFQVPVPEGAIRWRLDFNVSFQTPTKRALDAAHNWQQARGSGIYRERTSFEAVTRVTTGDMPP